MKRRSECPRDPRSPALILLAASFLSAVYTSQIYRLHLHGQRSKTNLHVTFLNIGQNGRLGNQLFQMASTIGIAESNDATWSFPVSIHRTAVGRLFRVEGDHTLEHVDKIQYKELYETFYRVELPQKRGVVSLQGYFQSRQFFEGSIDTLRKYMTISEQLLQKVQREVPEVRKLHAVTMHVRRGDFKLYLDNYRVLDTTYYLTALDELEIDVEVVIVVTDDADWCIENLIDNIPYKTILSPFSRTSNGELLDFILLYLGNNKILANSSFSWWAAFLRQIHSNSAQKGNVIAPSPWYNPKGTLARLNRRSFYPRSWKVLDTTHIVSHKQKTAGLDNLSSSAHKKRALQLSSIDS